MCVETGSAGFRLSLTPTLCYAQHGGSEAARQYLAMLGSQQRYQRDIWW